MRQVVILIGQDSPALRRREEHVRQAGYMTVVLSSWQHARRIMQRIRVAAVVTEAHLADGHSLAVLRALRAEAAWERVPLVVLGPLTDAERAAFAGDPLVHTQESGDGAGLIGRIVALVENGPTRPRDTAD